MAYDTRLTLRTSEKVEKIAASTEDTSPYLADQLVTKLGTTRVSELRGIIGDTGIPFEKLMVDYIMSL